MKTYKVTVLETRVVECVYVITAASEGQALIKAIGGETDSSTASPLYDVIDRDVTDCGLKGDE